MVLDFIEKKKKNENERQIERMNEWKLREKKAHKQNNNK